MTVPEWVRDSVREEAGDDAEILNVQILKDSTFGKMAAVQTEDRGFIVENKVFGRSNTFSVDFLGPGTGPAGGTGLPEVRTTVEPETVTETPEPTTETPSDPRSGSPVDTPEPETGTPAAEVEGEPVTLVEGIGETYESYLNDLGIFTLSDLTGADTETVADELGLSPTIVGRWQAQVELTSLNGIGPQYAELLVRSGVATIAGLSEADPADLLAAVNRKQQDLEVNIQGNVIGPKRVAGWIELARDHLGIDGSVEVPEPVEVEQAVAEDLTIITGIGATRAEQLAEHDITTVSDLIEADAETVAEGLGVGVSVVESWQDQADLTTIDGIGTARAEGLNEHGIVVTGQLVDADADEIAEALGVSTSQVETWKASANGADGN